MSDRESENEAATGGPGTIELGGVTYLVSQPTDQDFALIRARLRKQLANPLQAIAEDLKYLPAHLQTAAIDSAVRLKAGGGVELTESYIREELLKPEGAAFLAWLMLRKHQPTITLEVIRPLFTDDTTQDLLARLYEASGLGAVAAGKGIGRTG